MLFVAWCVSLLVVWRLRCDVSCMLFAVCWLVVVIVCCLLLLMSVVRLFGVFDWRRLLCVVVCCCVLVCVGVC